MAATRLILSLWLECLPIHYPHHCKCCLREKLLTNWLIYKLFSHCVGPDEVSLRPGRRTWREGAPMKVKRAPRPAYAWHGATKNGNGTANGGQDTSAARTFTIKVNNLPDLSGRVFNDVDNSGADEGEPGIEGVTVRLVGTDDAGPVDRSTVTAPDGSFLFEEWEGRKGSGKPSAQD